MKSKNKIIKGSIILTVTAVLVAFTVNFFSPSGIALVGQWNATTGVVTAKAKDQPIDDDLEIETAELAKKNFDSGKALFVDARSMEDFKEGHIKGAFALPVGEFDMHIDTFTSRYSPDTAIITYCSGRNCMDSHDLAQLLFMQGYSDVSVFIDGYPEWEMEGYPIE